MDLEPRTYSRLDPGTATELAHSASRALLRDRYPHHVRDFCKTTVTVGGAQEPGVECFNMNRRAYENDLSDVLVLPEPCSSAKNPTRREGSGWLRWVAWQYSKEKGAFRSDP